MQAVRQLCSRVILLDRGGVVFDGAPAESITKYFGKNDENGSTVNLDSGVRRNRHSDAILNTVQFLNLKGDLVAKAFATEKLIVRVTLSTQIRLHAMDLSMGVVHREGTRVFSQSFSDQEGTVAINPGNYQIDFQIDLKYLRLDSYFLALHLSNDTKSLDLLTAYPYLNYST